MSNKLEWESGAVFKATEWRKMQRDQCLRSLIRALPIHSLLAGESVQAGLLKRRKSKIENTVLQWVDNHIICSSLKQSEWIYWRLNVYGRSYLIPSDFCSDSWGAGNMTYYIPQNNHTYFLLNFCLWLQILLIQSRGTLLILKCTMIQLLYCSLRIQNAFLYLPIVLHQPGS